jgi:uncharacterized membrane protein HdeD (DUF308 family)
MAENQTPAFAELAAAIRENSGITTATGIILLIAGFMAVVSPFVAGLSITIMVGAMLAIGGAGQCVVAFKAGAFGRGVVIFLVGVAMLLVGIYLMQQPVTGLAKLTIILMAYLIATGLAEIAVAFQVRPAPGWGSELAAGIITLVLGILLWRQFPLSGAWAIGVLFGIKLMTSGWALILITKGAKQFAENQQADS